MIYLNEKRKWKKKVIKGKMAASTENEKGKIWRREKKKVSRRKKGRIKEKKIKERWKKDERGQYKNKTYKKKWKQVKKDKRNIGRREKRKESILIVRRERDICSSDDLNWGGMDCAKIIDVNISFRTDIDNTLLCFIFALNNLPLVRNSK